MRPWLPALLLLGAAACGSRPMSPDVPAGEAIVLAKPGQAGVTLKPLLVEQAKIAAARGLVPFVYLSLPVCKSCQALDAVFDSPLLVEARRGTYIIGVSMETWPEVIEGTLFGTGGPIYTPSFWRVHDDGSLGETISGGAWGADTPQNIAPKLAAFFRAHGVALTAKIVAPPPLQPSTTVEVDPATLSRAPDGIPEDAVLERTEGGVQIYRVHGEDKSDK